MTLKQRAIALGALALVGVVAWYRYTHRSGADRSAASGTVEATEAELGFAAGGRIVEIAAREGDSVKAGVVLARLDTLETAARLAQAQAQLAAGRARLRELEKGSRSEEIDEARAALDAAERSLTDAESDLQRTRRLAESDVVSRQSLDKAQVAYDLAQSRRSQAASQLTLVEAGPREEQIAAQRAQVRMNEAQVRSIEASLADEVLRSAFDGVVTVRHREPGEAVSPGAPILTVMNPNDRWVRIYVAENQLGAVRVGQKASITGDTFRGRTYGGEVTYIAHEAEFTPRNVQTTEDRVKLVYAVRVRITGDPNFELKPGTPADVRLNGEK